MPNLTDVTLHRSAFPAVLSALSRMPSVQPVWGSRLNGIISVSLLKTWRGRDWQQWWFWVFLSLEPSTCRGWDTSRCVGRRCMWIQLMGLNLWQGVQKSQGRTIASQTTLASAEMQRMALPFWGVGTSSSNVFSKGRKHFNSIFCKTAMKSIFSLCNIT